MADIYVNYETGNDSTGDGSPTGTGSGPYKKITKALSMAAASGDTVKCEDGPADGIYVEQIYIVATGHTGKDVTIEPADGNIYPIHVQGTATGWALLIANETITGTYTFKNILFQLHPDNTTRYTPIYPIGSAKNLTFDTCTILNAGTGGGIHTVSPYSGTITLINCTLTATDTQCVYMASGNLTASVCTFHSGYHGVYVEGVSSACNIDIQYCTFTSDHDSSSCVPLYFHSNSIPVSVRFNNNIVTECCGGVLAPSVVSFDYIEIKDNTFTLSGSAAATGIYLGYDKNWSSGLCGSGIVSGNTVDMGVLASHGMLIGQGIVNLEIFNNTVIGGNYNCVIKGDSNNIHHNVFYGPLTFYIAGGQFNKVYNNTILGTSSYCCFINVNTDDTPRVPTGNVFIDNIMDASGGSTYAFAILAENKHFNTITDYNCLYAGSSGLVLLDATALNTIAEVQTKWASNVFDTPNYFALNDAHSVNVNPSFDADYNMNARIMSMLGSPDINGNKDVMGATRQGVKIGKSRLLSTQLFTS